MKRPAPLRIGYDPDFAPISFTDVQGRAAGAAVERLTAAAGAADIDVDWVPVALLDQWQRLASGHVDALAAIGDTPQRRRECFLSPAYLLTGAGWFVPADAPAFDPAGAPPGSRIVTPGSGPLPALVAARWPHLDPAAVPGYDDALQEVRAGLASAAALNIDVAGLMCRTRLQSLFRLPDAPFAEVGLALAAMPGAGAARIADLAAMLPKAQKLPLDLGSPNPH